MKKLTFLVIFLISVTSAFGKIELPLLVGDHMVLQRNTEVKLWGRSTVKKDVTITTSWNNKTYKVKTDKNGDWIATVSTGDAGGPYSITLSDGEELVLNDILLGEVWICSGQSNMEFPVCGFINQPNKGGLETILEAPKYPNIRMFAVLRNSVDEPQKDCKGGEWLTSNYQSVSSFSAVAYYFGQMLSDALDVPIGLITPNWGGSKIEAWMSEESIKNTVGINQELAFSGKGDESKPARLFNGMIYPLINYTAKGFIWYQGESNREAYFDYKELHKSMISLWRNLWGNDKMPFYMVQLAPYNYDGAEYRSLALTVEAQMQVIAEVPYTGIAATTDLGHPSNIHPPFKKEVGQRLAFLALNHDYNIKGLPFDAPTYKSLEVTDKGIMLSFNNLSTSGNAMEPNSLAGFNEKGVSAIKGFEVAGEDKKFYPAKARFIWWQNKIEVSADEVTNPVAVRYAFKNFPEANVVTTFGIPLLPFRTDNWTIPEDEIFKKK